MTESATRKIIHVDMDAFYASVEIRDNPELAGKPVVVGGSPASRGVVATASYEARKFGIRSAMPCSMAARLCPAAIFVRPDFDKYVAVAAQLREIFRRHTLMIEPIALDEAYLDVTNPPSGLYAIQIAKQIQHAVREELGLSCSAGVAPNKMLAKIASDLKKPGGISVVLPEKVEDFMRHLPLRKINGIGPATEKRLKEKGFSVCSDVWKVSESRLHELFGERMAKWISERSRGIDPRQVETSRIRKSIGCEDTLASDATTVSEVEMALTSVAREFARRLDRKNAAGRTLTLKVRYGDFSQVTRAMTVDSPLDGNNLATIMECARTLLRRTDGGRRPVRLIGLSLKLNETGQP